MMTLLVLILVAITSTTLVIARLGGEQSNRRQDTIVINDIFSDNGNNDQEEDREQEVMIGTNCTGTPWNCSEFGRGGIEYCYSSAGVNWTGCHWRGTSNTDALDGHCYGIPKPCSDYHSDRVGCLMMGCTPED